MQLALSGWPGPIWADESPLCALPRRASSWLALLGVWSCVGLLLMSIRPAPDELRGHIHRGRHGGCTLLETPDGRTLLYDAGRWQVRDDSSAHCTVSLVAEHPSHRRGVLSHADLDHFNGLPALLERFAIGQVTVTPSFFDKDRPGVRVVQELLHRRGIPIRSSAIRRCFSGGRSRNHPIASDPWKAYRDRMKIREHGAAGAAFQTANPFDG